MVKILGESWYKEIWTLDVKGQSWVEETALEVDFLVRTLRLRRGARVLDLACGFGRHALELSRRGFAVVGVDLTRDYVADARRTATAQGLSAQFVHADIREIPYREEFDAVLNLADGAIGYLENDAENLKSFDTIARALRPGGQHFLEVCNAAHARCCFPRRHWEAGTEALSLAQFDWLPETRKMVYAGWTLPYGEPLREPEDVTASSWRLYDREELAEILGARGLDIVATYCDYTGAPESERELQLLVHSRKR